MKSNLRLAGLISLMLAMPAAVVAIEQAAPGGQPEAAESPAAVAAAVAQPVEPAAPAAAEDRAPVANISGIVGLVRATPSSTFPVGDSDTEWQILPSQVAYFERLEQERRHLVARGDVFPQGDSDTEWQMLPVQVAYFDRIERERVAAAQPAQPASEVQAEAVPAAAAPSNPLRTALNYITSLFKPDGPSAPANSSAAK